MLKVTNVSKSFQKGGALKDVSFHVRPKSITGLAGASGSGKTTLLRCIQGFETYDAGSITYEGQSGFIFQDFQLFYHMTVLQNLVYAPSLCQKGDHEQRACELLNTLGVLTKKDCYPAHLSGGQRQRVALARALMLQPDLLLCDEPTSGLDVLSILEVSTLLKQVRDMGITVLISSHDLHFLCDVAERIIVLKNGAVEASVRSESIKDPVEYLKKHY